MDEEREKQRELDAYIAEKTKEPVYEEPFQPKPTPPSSEVDLGIIAFAVGIVAYVVILVIATIAGGIGGAFTILGFGILLLAIFGN